MDLGLDIDDLDPCWQQAMFILKGGIAKEQKLMRERRTRG